MKSITKHQETNNLKELQHELGLLRQSIKAQGMSQINRNAKNVLTSLANDSQIDELQKTRTLKIKQQASQNQ